MGASPRGHFSLFFPGFRFSVVKEEERNMLPFPNIFIVIATTMFYAK